MLPMQDERTTNNEQLKIELLSQWKLEAEFRNKEPSVIIRWIAILSLVTSLVFLSSANHISQRKTRMMMLMNTLKTMVARMKMIPLVMRN